MAKSKKKAPWLHASEHLKVAEYLRHQTVNFVIQTGAEEAEQLFGMADQIMHSIRDLKGNRPLERENFGITIDVKGKLTWIGWISLDWTVLLQV